MQPNILWIMTDQQNSSMMSCTGNPYLHTPAIDSLAKEGIRFTNTYCANPVCLPSRFSLFTGLYPSTIGVKSNNFKAEMPQENLPAFIEENGFGRLLKEAGYTAVYGGKEHLPATCAAGLGFDYICKDERDILADTCADFLREYRSDKPYFMVASFVNPHDICYMAISDQAVTEDDRYRRDQRPVETGTMRRAQKMPDDPGRTVPDALRPPLPENYFPADDEAEAIDMLITKRAFRKRARERYTDADWRLHRYTYARLTELADRQIGKVLDAARGRSDYANTIVLFTSDHGDMDASHKLEHKTVLYEESAKVPLVAKGLCTDGGKTCDALVCNGLDLICTVLDYAHAETPAYLQGLSLRKLMEQEETDLPRKTVMVESEIGKMVVDKTRKYIHHFDGARKDQFYDLTTNPHEMFNQLEDPAYRETIENLRRALQQHEKETEESARKI